MYKSPVVVELFRLLCHTTVDLLMLQSPLRVLQVGLQLALLDLEPPALFVQLVDGTAAVVQLVQQILDLVAALILVDFWYILTFLRFVLPSVGTAQSCSSGNRSASPRPGTRPGPCQSSCPLRGDGLRSEGPQPPIVEGGRCRCCVRRYSETH